MGENSAISWTDHTFNPWEGCREVSPACDNCYAKRRDIRLHGGEHWGKDSDRLMHTDAYWRQARGWNKQAEMEGTRKRVFCGSLCDVMENDSTLQTAARIRLYNLIESTPYLDWLLLTKRPQNFKRLLPMEWVVSGLPDNVWPMTTVESNEYLWRADEILKLDARQYGLSMEPLLGPVDLGSRLQGSRRITWVIAGGESGSGARPSHPDWFRSLRDQCKAAGVSFHFKQHGEWAPCGFTNGRYSNSRFHRFVDGQFMEFVGTKAAGRLLDGVEHLEVPSA